MKRRWLSASGDIGASSPTRDHGRPDPVGWPRLLTSAAAVTVTAAVVTIVLSAVEPALPRVLPDYAG